MRPLAALAEAAVDAEARVRCLRLQRKVGCFRPSTCADASKTEAAGWVAKVPNKKAAVTSPRWLTFTGALIHRILYRKFCRIKDGKLHSKVFLRRCNQTT